MGKISNIRPAPEEVTVAGETFQVKPLTNSELLNHLEKIDDSQGGDADIKEFFLGLMYESLKEDTEDVNSVEDVANAPASLFGPVFQTIEDINDLDFLDEEEREKALEQLQ